MSHDTTTHPARPTPAFVWGYNNRAGLGLGHTARVPRPTSAALPANTVGVQGGINFTVALTADGALYAWGGNQYGQLGDGSTTIRREPAPVALPGHAKVSAIAAGTDHVLALTRDRQVLAWGRNHRGQIGIGSTSDQHTPVAVLGPGIASIGAGNAISAAVTDQGELQVWGRNSFGQLGLPPVLAPRHGLDGLHEVHEHQLRPGTAVLPQGAQAALVAAGQRHLAVLTTGGKLLQFGIDAAGTPQAGELPLEPSWGRPVQICAGDDFTLVRTDRGLLLAVGGNGDGQLGLGDRRARTTPALVTLPHAHGTVAGIWAGARSGLAITSAHEVYTWGDSSLGQTGHGDPQRPGAAAQPTPRKIDALSGTRLSNASGGAHHMILTAA
jgi:alpha-tubulin suppressor-like RCC1 family protein